MKSCLGTLVNLNTHYAAKSMWTPKDFNHMCLFNISRSATVALVRSGTNDGQGSAQASQVLPQQTQKSISLKLH